MVNVPGDSVGVVETRLARLKLPAGGFVLEHGGTLTELIVAYETYGTLSPNRDNAIFICPTLTSDAHAAGYHDVSTPEAMKKTEGWWNPMIGPGKGIDTGHYYVICANILGGCMGTTGPASLSPVTGQPYGSTFPRFTIGDVVEVHRRLVAHLGVKQLAAVIGGSLGGMQALEWTLRSPDMIQRCICIASAANLSTQALAFDIVGREAITSDAGWLAGDYYDTGRKPEQGLSLARKIGHITYLSQEMMELRFGRTRRDLRRAGGGQPDRFRTDFEIESYLDHQGRKFTDRFDANSYLHITRAMDEYDLLESRDASEKTYAAIRAKMLIVALSHDWLFPPEQSAEIANGLLQAGKQVSYCSLYSPYGHDGFLVSIEHLSEIVRAFLPWVLEAPAPAPAPVASVARPGELTPCPECGCSDCRLRMADTCTEEHQVIADMIEPGSKVLDLGCGDGELLTLLAETKQVRGLGMDIDISQVIHVLDRGHDVFQADIDAGLQMVPDGMYDYAVLSETLQVIRRPLEVLRELLRVARMGIVSFPNFGNLSHRVSLWTTGKMPVGGSLPHAWYNTPNIHLFTLRDFIDICREDGIKITQMVCIPKRPLDRLLVRLGFHNLGADRVLVKIARK